MKFYRIQVTKIKSQTLVGQKFSIEVPNSVPSGFIFTLAEYQARKVGNGTSEEVFALNKIGIHEE